MQEPPAQDRQSIDPVPAIRDAARGGRLKSPLPFHITLCCFAAVTVIVPVKAIAQKGAPQPGHDERMLRTKWLSCCERVRGGDPWSDIADELEEILAVEGDSPTRTLLEDYLTSMREADRPGPPAPSGIPDSSTPEELVALLTESRLVEVQRSNGRLIDAPLHLHTNATGPATMHWDTLAAGAAASADEPTVRIVRRGREMIPALIEALDDLALTRCTLIVTTTNRASVILRKCDLAMTLVQVISRCKFYTADRGRWFSQFEPAFRDEIIRSVRDWWQATKDLTPLEARSWLIARATVEQAQPMISLLALDGHESRAVTHLRAFLNTDNAKLRVRVVRQLAALGDLSGVAHTCERLRDGAAIAQDDAEILIVFGDRREYRILRGIMETHLAEGGKAADSPVTVILRAAARYKDQRMAIPLLALALGADDVPMRRVQGMTLATDATQADVAASLIQELTRRNFRYDRAAEHDLRRKAIARVRDWWEREGEGLYGYHSARLRRGGGIR